MALIAIAVAFLCVPVSYSQWYYNTGEAYINLKIRGDFMIEPEKSPASIKSVSVNLSFLPYENYRQEAEEIKGRVVAINVTDKNGYNISVY